MGLWDGNLRNSPGDIVLDSIIVLGIGIAYCFQIFRLWIASSTHGLSPLFLLFHALFSNLQLANTLLLNARAWPNDRDPILERIGRGSVHGAEAFGALLGLVQVAVQWGGSIALIVLYATKASISNGQSGYFANSTSISATAFIHAALFLFPAMAIALPKPSSRNWDNDIFTGFSAIVNTWMALVFVVMELYPQVGEFRRMRGLPGALSPASLSVRAVVLLAIAVRWFMRLGAPTWGHQPAPLTLWFQWGWISINYINESLVCMILVVMYLRAGRLNEGWNRVFEETPLLAP